MSIFFTESLPCTKGTSTKKENSGPLLRVL